MGVGLLLRRLRLLRLRRRLPRLLRLLPRLRLRRLLLKRPRLRLRLSLLLRRPRLSVTPLSEHIPCLAGAFIWQRSNTERIAAG